MQAEFKQKLDAMVAASDGKLTVASGDRDTATQQKLWDEAVKKYGPDEARNWVAPAGHSNHEKGIAADLGGDLEWAHQHAAEFGLYFPMSWENWHVEPFGSRDTSDPQAYTPQPAAPGATTAGDPMLWLVNMLGAGDPMFAGNASALPEQNTFDQALTSARPSAPGTPQPAQATQGGPAPVEGSYEAWVAEIARQKGLTPEEVAAFRQLGLGESGGQNVWQQVHDVNTDNGDPAFGPWQVIGTTFAAHADPGHGDRFNPVDSGLAAVNYMRSRYGKIVSEPGY